MNILVKFSMDDDGCIVDNAGWHLVDPANLQGNAALCTGEFFGGGESSVVFEVKSAQKGGITCLKCLEILKIYKAVKL